jgi:predicted O-methyltransferase YrrM
MLIVYLQTIRSLEEEFKRIKRLSKNQILKSIANVDDKLREELPMLEEKLNIDDLEERISTFESRIIRSMKEMNDNLYYQIDSLIAINKVMDDLKAPLPEFRGWAASPDFLRILMAQILKNKPRILVELGSGSSTIISAHCMKTNGIGQVLSFDHDENYYRTTSENIKFYGLDKFAEVVHAPLKNYKIKGVNYLWYDTEMIKSGGPIEMLVVDGPPARLQKNARYPALPLLVEQLADKALIIVDDYIRQDEQQMVALWMKAFTLETVSTINTEKGLIILRYNKPA